MHKLKIDPIELLVFNEERPVITSSRALQQLNPLHAVQVLYYMIRQEPVESDELLPSGITTWRTYCLLNAFMLFHTFK